MKISNRVDVSGLTKLTSGSYTGNSTVNRAVAHGLERIPKLVRIYEVGEELMWDLLAELGNLVIDGGSYLWWYDVTEADVTNFYVGNAGSYADSANYNGTEYKWVAFG